MRNNTPFSIFCRFVKGHHGCDAELLYLVESMQDRLNQLNILYDDIKLQENVVKEHMKKLGKDGYGHIDPLLKLSLLMESYINTLYSFFENVSRINVYFHKEKNLSPRFWKQKERIIKDNIKPLSQFLKKASWIDEIKVIRDEHSHFLAGLIVFTPDNGGHLSPTFHNKVINKRNFKVLKGIKEFNKKMNYIEFLIGKLNKFLDVYGKHFLSKMDNGVEVILPYRDENGIIKFEKINCINYVKKYCPKYLKLLKSLA